MQRGHALGCENQHLPPFYELFADFLDENNINVTQQQPKRFPGKSRAFQSKISRARSGKSLLSPDELTILLQEWGCRMDLKIAILRSFYCEHMGAAQVSKTNPIDFNDFDKFFLDDDDSGSNTGDEGIGSDE